MGKIECSPLPLQGVYLLNLNKFEDVRGEFTRLFCRDELKNLFGERTIVQINHSLTRKKGAIRGLHYQESPFAEMKIIRCLKGSVFDVMIDLRPDSQTYLKWFGVILSRSNPQAVVIPEGFAHGFQTLEEDSELLYLHTNFYNTSSERGVRFDDPAIGIKWPLPVSEVSERDRRHPLLKGGNNGS